MSHILESYCKTNNVIKKEKLLLKRNHRLTNIRKNYLNQTISEIVDRKPRFICIEDLNVSGMIKNRHLSKAVQEQGAEYHSAHRNALRSTEGRSAFFGYRICRSTDGAARKRCRIRGAE